MTILNSFFINHKSLFQLKSNMKINDTKHHLVALVDNSSNLNIYILKEFWKIWMN